MGHKLTETGRTTFVNTLCGQKVLQSKEADDAENAHLEEGVRIKPYTVGTASPRPFKFAHTDLLQNSSSMTRAHEYPLP